MPKTGVHWFRHGLRMHDNPALVACLDEVERFLPVFIFDGKTANTDTCGYIRFRFLLDSLRDLERRFKNFNINFMCFYGQPHVVLEKLVRTYDVSVISFEKDSEACWFKRDNLVKEMAKKHNVQIIERVSHTLYDPDEVFNLNNGSPPNTYEQLKKLCLRIGDPAEPIASPDLKFFSSHLLNTNDFYNESEHKVPDLDYFNLKPECKEQERVIFEGGETKALELFAKRQQVEKEAFVNGVANPNMVKPILFIKEVPLSPYFASGCLSVRKFFWEIKDAYDKYYAGEKNFFIPAEQLFWREFFYHLAYKNDKFDKIDGNIMSFKIPWDYGREDLLIKWKTGTTGYPWIDASMRQLKQEGWLHHLCRNSVAIFLTRGQCFLSWHKGHDVFMEYLIDCDWAVNAGNWNWVSSGDPEEIQENLSSICPVRNPKKIDPNGDYIRKYCPELKYLPNEYLFEPWKAPAAVQELANCVVGRDYPEPCLDYEQARQDNIIKLQQYFLTEKKDIFEIFRNERNVIKASNPSEYRTFTYAKFLESEFEDF